MRTAVFAALVTTALARTSRDEMLFMKANGEVDDSPIGMLKVTKQELADTLDAHANSNSPIQLPNIGVGTAQLSNGISAWVDIPEGVYREVPEWMEYQLDAIVTSSVVTEAYPFFFQCKPRTASHCEMYAFAYPCLDCHDFEHGDFIKHMVADGWEVFKCTPSVEFENSPGHLHKMVGLRKTIDSGEKILKYLDEASEFFSFAIDQEPQVCESIADETVCTQNTKGKCLWESGQCVFNTCRPGGMYGPGVCTTHCITDDVPTTRTP
ncbi:hypothetical protein DIPPA_16947 [Diplonema papillatum]|nr:hypothetical protein DIPPA_16947 [Diplonema papillatum]